VNLPSQNQYAQPCQLWDYITVVILVHWYATSMMLILTIQISMWRLYYPDRALLHTWPSYGIYIAASGDSWLHTKAHGVTQLELLMLASHLTTFPNFCISTRSQTVSWDVSLFFTCFYCFLQHMQSEVLLNSNVALWDILRRMF
jgi:hypothetical protein